MRTAKSSALFLLVTRGLEENYAIRRLVRRIVGVRIPHPKIEELALQAKGVGIFAQRAKFSRKRKFVRTCATVSSLLCDINAQV